MGRCCSIPETKKTLAESDALAVQKAGHQKMRREDVLCFACQRPCRTQYLYQRLDLNTIGMCDACFHDFSHFEL